MRLSVSKSRYLSRIAIASVATFLLGGALGCSTAKKVAATAAGAATGSSNSGGGGGGGNPVSSVGGPPSASNAPEDLQCDGVYSPRDLTDSFSLMYCDPQGVNEDVISQGRGNVRRAMKTSAPHIKARWRASYVHLCSTELKERRKHYPNMALTCKWHAEKFNFDDLVEEESWMSDNMKDHIRSQVESGRKHIEKVVQSEFSREENKREWEVYWDLREQVWQEFLEDRQNYSEYYKVVEDFREGAAKGDVEGCVEPLKSKLKKYVNNADRKGRKTIIDRFGDSVGYAMTESLARCHWYHDRTFQTGMYLQLLDDKRRQVNFGERLYYAQLAEVQKDAKKKEKMPHLEGKKLLELEPDQLTPPSLFERSEAEEKWRQDGYDLAGDVSFVDQTIARVSGNTVHFPQKSYQRAVKECEETNRIDRITHTGDVIYEQTCRTVGHETVTSQVDPLELDGDYGLRGGDWVKIARHTGSDARTLFIGARGGESDSRVVRVVDIQLE
jgi:hypothetical protein